MTLTMTQQARMRGLKASIMVRGRAVVANTDEKLSVMVEDQAALSDPDKPAQAQLQVYTLLTAAAGAVADPRAIEKFTEEDGRWHRVIEYRESRGDMLTWKWFCESQRA